ncbi:RNA 2',3'-cyclic phosphodiesterase [Desulfitobacterium sp. Sab5]|uniref:RNA 2',3'-cyclic phosphodiesterase n=1 Tax=Desulfitobacterium nosdiversum TaxID=3375356 RepID=UPI003CFA3110
MRLFIGIDLPKELKQALLNFQHELKALGFQGAWKSPDNFHLTLEFLGELDSGNVTKLNETITSVVNNYHPFALKLAGLGAFPSFKRPHTLWTSLQGSIGELNRLRAELYDLLRKNGFILEERPFKPHITLASRPQLEDIDLSAVQSRELGGFSVTEVILFESKVIRGKRMYLDLSRTNLVNG